MYRVTIEQALAQAHARFLGVPGVVGVSRVGNTIVFYVETPADRAKVPSVSFMGYPVRVVVVGRFRPLR